jgi:hypothetical protein
MSRRRKVQFNDGSNIKETLHNQDCIDLIIPIGTILPYAGVVLPSNKFKFCDGEELSRGTYSKLFNIIGEKYGAGDGVLTFNLPNLIGRFLECTDNIDTVGLYKEAALPNIKGEFMATNELNYLLATTFTGTGAIKDYPYRGDYASRAGGGDDPHSKGFDFDASRCSSIYKDDCTTVQPKSLTVNYIIRVS